MKNGLGAVPFRVPNLGAELAKTLNLQRCSLDHEAETYAKQREWAIYKRENALMAGRRGKAARTFW